MDSLETRYMKAHNAVVNCFDPTPEQWKEFEEAEKDLKADRRVDMPSLRNCPRRLYSQLRSPD